MTRCSVAALARSDPRAGTAPPTRHWLLLEHPGPWPIDAVAGSGIEAEVLALLTGAAAATRTRILLVRRPGRQPRAGTRRWMLLTPGQPTASGSWHIDNDLLAAHLALLRAQPGAGLGEAAGNDRGGEDPPQHRPLDDAGRSDAEPHQSGSAEADAVILVCAHGVHDTCCALQGRPVAAALAERWPEQVWECSHVGGDRFAPNVLVLPDGFYYGGLDPDGAVTTVEQHLRGRVQTDHLRGMARFLPAQQAAAVAAFDRYGPLPPDAVVVIRSQHEGRYGSPDSRTHVELEVRGVPHRVHAEILALPRPPAQLTCRALRETTATEYRVQHLG